LLATDQIHDVKPGLEAVQNKQTEKLVHDFLVSVGMSQEDAERSGISVRDSKLRPLLGTLGGHRMLILPGSITIRLLIHGRLVALLTRS